MTDANFEQLPLEKQMSHVWKKLTKLMDTVDGANTVMNTRIDDMNARIDDTNARIEYVRGIRVISQPNSHSDSC